MATGHLNQCPDCGASLDVETEASAAGRCPVCGDVTQHVRNHVRMSVGDGHGRMGQYPPSWEDSRGDAEEPEASLRE